MIAKQIEKLGISLSDAFTERAKHYFAQAGTAEGPTKNNFNLMGAVMGEIGRVILDVTKRESS